MVDSVGIHDEVYSNRLVQKENSTTTPTEIPPYFRNSIEIYSRPRQSNMVSADSFYSNVCKYMHYFRVPLICQM